MAWDRYLTNVAGRQGLVLLDRSFAAAPPTTQLPVLAWFGIWALLPSGAAFWDPAEGNVLDALEDVLLDRAGQIAHGWGVYVRRLATPGLREYYFYTAPTVNLAPALAEVRKRFPKYRVEHEHAPDPEWAQYREWTAEPAEPLS